MGLNGTPASILAQHMGVATITDTALHGFERNFNALNAQGRAVYYTEFIKKFGHIDTAWTNFPRLVEKFAEVRQGDGSQAYLLTNVNPTPGELYDPEFNHNDAARFLFGNHKPDYRQAAIAQVRNWTKATSIREHELAAADFGGTLNLIGRTKDSLENSDRLSEWNLTLGMLFDAMRRDIAHVVTTPNPTDEETARSFSALLGAYTDYLSVPSAKYNSAGVTKIFNPSEIIVITRTTLWQTLAKSQYSGAFNTEYMRGVSDEQFVTIPDEHWPSDLEDVTAVILSRGTDATVTIVDNAITQAAVVNAPWDSVNHTLTHRSVYGINPFGAFIVIKNGAQQSVAGSTPVPADVEFEILLNGAPVTELRRGYDYTIRAVAKDTNGFLAGRADVYIGSEGTRKVSATSPTDRTFIAVDDLNLYIGLDDEATNLIIRAEAVLDTTIGKSITLPVVGDRFNLTPRPELAEGDNPPATGGGEGTGGGGGGGLQTINLTPAQIVTISGNTATGTGPKTGYYVEVSGTRDGQAFNQTLGDNGQVNVVRPGDSLTFTARAQQGYQITGTASRTLTYS